MGPERARDAIRKGLSMGADRGILITDEKLAGADALLTGKALAAAIKAESPDLVICATESYDGSTGMVPPILAELLGVPQLTFAKKVEVDGTNLKVNRQTADGYMVVEAAMPALITVTAAIAEPRYASLKGIMAARSKEIKQVSLQDLGVEGGGPAETIESVTSAEARKAGSIIEDDGTAVDQIVKVLAEAKVICDGEGLRLRRAQRRQAQLGSPRDHRQGARAWRRQRGRARDRCQGGGGKAGQARREGRV